MEKRGLRGRIDENITLGRMYDTDQCSKIELEHITRKERTSQNLRPWSCATLHH